MRRKSTRVATVTLASVLAIVVAGLVLWFVPLSFGDTARVSLSEFTRAKGRAEKLLKVELEQRPEEYGYNGDLAQDVFEMGGAIPNIYVASGKVTVDLAAPSYPIYCNGTPIAALCTYPGGRGDPDVTGNYSFIAPIDDDFSAFMSASPSYADVHLGDFQIVEIEGDEWAFEGTDWSAGKDGSWLEYSSLPEEFQVAREASLKPEDLSEDVLAQFKYSDGGIRVPLSIG